MHRLLATGAIVAVSLCVVANASAHQASITSAELRVSADATQLDYRLRIAGDDLYEVLDHDLETPLTADDIRRGRTELLAYLQARITLETEPPARCPTTDQGLEVATEEGSLWAIASWSWRCEHPIDRMTLDYDLFFELDPLHTCALRASWREQRANALLSDESNRFTWFFGEPPPSGFTAFVVSGIEHILLGVDHLLFLLSLLLVVVIHRTPSAEVVLRRSGDSLRYALTVVTSFTVAHSLTLIAAALDWIPIHPRLVESIIALSIVYVAVEDVIRVDPPRRYLVTFGFGLLHGMGFASVLRELLPDEGIVAPVLAFNIGVEVGQLAVVAALCPLLFLLARGIGARHYRRIVVPGVAVVLAVVGTVWLIERATGS